MDDGEKEKFKIDQSAVERAVHLTLAKSDTYDAQMPVSMKYKQLMNDVLSVEVTNNGSVTLMEFESNGVQPTSGNDGLTCSICGEVFTLVKDLRQHENEKHAQKGLQCSYCERWCPTKSALARHERIHTGMEMRPGLED
jgi:uncharacterized C2H2 Zn-finger protein